jgi:hypothetical protein
MQSDKPFTSALTPSGRPTDMKPHNEIPSSGMQSDVDQNIHNQSFPLQVACADDASMV